MRILVIGGTAFIGKALVHELTKAGHEVSILHRRHQNPFGKKVANLTADRNQIETVRRALGRLKFDAVYDLAYDWEHGTNAQQAEATALLFDGHVSRYIFMSSVAAYGDGLNHHEGDALAPDDHPDRYVRNKAMSERSLFRLHQRTGFPIVTIRPPYVYGPGSPFYREAFFWDRFRAGRKVILPSDGHRLMQFVYVDDLVRLAMRLLDSRNAIGHAFNAANARALTQHEVVNELAKAAGVREPELVSIPRDRILQMGGSPFGPKLYFGYYYDLPAITEVITKAQRMLAFRPTDFATGLKTTYKAYVKHRDFPKPDFSFEDEVFARFGHDALKSTKLQNG
ncbi:MAG TPA: NAD-dependent epimerase/dehydratase family protein [Bryobacteraceae bacterium]|nr:NAD-dependent epimerase/dehydratase family protein [Bryobacteraceae bacterium]